MQLKSKRQRWRQRQQNLRRQSASLAVPPSHGLLVPTEDPNICVVFAEADRIYRFEAMRLARASRRYAGDESEEAAIANANEQTTIRLAEMRDTLTPLIEALWRHLSLIAECPGSRGWDLRGVRYARGAVEGMAVRLRTPMADLYKMISRTELKESPVPEVLGERFAPLRWLLGADEVVKMRGPIGLRNSRVLIATTRRILVLNQANFEKTGTIENEHLLEDCLIQVSYQPICRVGIWKLPRLSGRSPDYTVYWTNGEDHEQRLQRAIDGLNESRHRLVASKHPAYASEDQT